ncbi:MAG: hypothetical protein GXP35_06250 [Actinobacteria bacterium]|nr:hypothetical protein [Actinomycetota bacterium]
MVGTIPADPAVVAADKEGCSPLDRYSGPFVEAIEALVATVEETYDE